MDFTQHAIEDGSGEVLILLHGNGEDSTIFSSLIPRLSDRYHVIALDTRGHGRSTRGEAPFRLTQFARDLYNFVTLRDMTSLHLLGFSDGGNIALLFALEHPEMVRSLVLNGANLYPTGMRTAVYLSMLGEYALQSFLSLFRKDRRASCELLSLMVHEPHISRASLKKLRVPALVLVGDHDMIRASHSAAIARALPQGQLCTLPGSHFILQENPEAYYDAVSSFLE